MLYKNLSILILLLLLTIFDIKFVGAGNAILSWEAPTTNTDDSCCTDLAGYKIYYGTMSGIYSNSEDTGNILCEDTGLSSGTGCGNVVTCTHVIDDLQEGMWYFVVTSYDFAGNESDLSNEATKNINITDTVAPNRPTNVQCGI